MEKGKKKTIECQSVLEPLQFMQKCAVEAMDQLNPLKSSGVWEAKRELMRIVSISRQLLSQLENRVC